MVSSVGPEATLFLEWAGPVIQQLFALALAGEGWAMFKAKEAPRSGLGFTSTCSCCLTWTCYGIAAQSPSIWVPNVFGVVVGTVTTAVFVSLTEQRMGTTLAVIAALAVAVLALMFGDVLPEDQAKQWTANIGILQAIVMLGNGAAVWPTVAAEGDSSALSVPVRPPHPTPNTSPAEPTRVRQLSLAGGFQGLCWALFGILVIQDQNIYMPNLLGMCCNIVNIILVMVYPSKAAAPAKAVRD